MRSVIKLPYNVNSESTDMVTHYEILSLVIQKALVPVIEKLNKGIELTKGDTISIYEISFTFFIVMVDYALIYSIWY